MLADVSTLEELELARINPGQKRVTPKKRNPNRMMAPLRLLGLLKREVHPFFFLGLA